MPANKKLLMLPGDGIGPEVMNQVQRVIDWMDKTRHVSFDVAEDLVGGCAYDAHGTSLTDNTLADAMGVDAVLLGAVGGPKWDNVERDLRPEAGLLKLRKELDLFANLRPATVFPALAEASSLKTELVSGLDMLIIRELTRGVYFGTPRGIEDLGNGEKRAVDTQVYTSGEIDRVCRVAFEMAFEKPEIRVDVEFGDDVALIISTAVVGYLDDAVEHQHRRQRQLGVAGTEQLAVPTGQQILVGVTVFFFRQRLNDPLSPVRRWAQYIIPDR